MKDLHQQQLHLRGMDPLQGRRLFVLKRDSRIEEFNEARISLAIESAFKAEQGVSSDARLPETLQAAVKKCADAVVEKVLSRAVRGEQLQVEKIQDAVEDQLMVEGHLAVARRYILYRENRRLARAEREGRGAPAVKKKKMPAVSPSPVVPVSAPVREKEPVVAPPPPISLPARPWLEKIYSQALPGWVSGGLEAAQRGHFVNYIADAGYLNLLAPEMVEFDLPKLAGALRPERDELFPAGGLQALHDEYLLHENGRRLETPQYFWMRLAMGLALNEGEQRNARAVEFYEALSTFRFLPSETILLNAGKVDARLSDCSVATSWSDLEHVTTQIGPGQPRPSKKGLTCSWLEPWHSGISAFLERPRPGDLPWEHDLNKALWMPDLFMKRVRERGHWTLFEQAQVSDLHHKFGREFEDAYREYEKRAERGEMPGSQRINALDLWREILASLEQTGQPWLGFKDAANLRSLQGQSGVVRRASVCTSLLFDNSRSQATACAVGAINLAAHLSGDGNVALDVSLLRQTVATGLRMLDNAIDLGSYPDDAGRRAACENRAVALGVAGFQDALDRLKIEYASVAAAEFADRGAELISHGALLESARLAAERGVYPGYAESKWSQGLLPVDTLALLANERGQAVDVDSSMTEDWGMVRDAIRLHGLRNGSVTGIASSDAGSKITGVSQSIEPEPGALMCGAQWLIECAARRQKWLDLGQTLAIYASDIDLTELGEIVMQAWEKGLKTVRQFYISPREAGGAATASLTATPADSSLRQKRQPAAAR